MKVKQGQIRKASLNPIIIAFFLTQAFLFMRLGEAGAQIDKAAVAEAMKLGAKEFIAKPLEDLDGLLSLVKKALNNGGHESEKR